MKLSKRVIALCLTAALLLPGTIFARGDGQTSGGVAAYTVLPATEFASTNLYGSAQDISYLDPNGNQVSGKMVSGADNTAPVSYNSLSTYTDKSNTPYVEYAVEAPADGSYAIQVGMNCTYDASKGVEPYSAVVVNGQDVYKAVFKGDSGATAFAPLTVTLRKGRNLIRCTSFTSDEAAAVSAMNQVFLGVQTSSDPSQALTGVVDGQGTTVEAENTIHGRYSVADDSTASGGKKLGWSTATFSQQMALSVDKLSVDTLPEFPYFSFTVTAPEDGYYDMTAYFDTDQDTLKSGYFGMMVDGQVQARPYSVRNGAWNLQANRMDAGAYLTKGNHVVVLTDQQPKTSSDTNVHVWMDYDRVVLDSGLTLASTQTDPRLTSKYTRLEAETYASCNLYSSKDTSSSYSGGVSVGGGQTWANQTLAQMSGYLNKSKTSYVQYVVNAPAAGDYDIRAGVYFGEMSGAKDLSGQILSIGVLANDKVYTVPLVGQVNSSQPLALKVSLKAGRNVIRVTDFAGDWNASGLEDKRWVNQDYLDIQSDLTGVSNSSVKVEAESSSYINNYSVNTDTTASGGKALGSANFTVAKYLNMTLDTLTVATLRTVPYFSITVTAPADGYYDITAFTGCDTGDIESGYYGLFVDGVLQKRAYDSPSWVTYANNRWDASTYMTKGDHVLVLTASIPEDASKLTVTSYGNRWTNFDYLTLGGGLTMAATQQNPLSSLHMTRMEAEDYAEQNLYSNLDYSATHSGGAAVGGANGGSLESLSDMQVFLDKSKEPYVQYTVDSPDTNDYTVNVGINFGTTASSLSFTPYFFVYVNGTPIKVNFTYPYGTDQSIPVKVSLKQGRNIIQVTYQTSDEVASAPGKYLWFNQDYLEVPDRLTAVKATSATKLEAETATYRSGYSPSSATRYSAGAALGWGSIAGLTAGVTTKNLSRNNFDACGYVSVTVNAPVSGYYTVGAGVFNADAVQIGKLGLLVDGTAYPMQFYTNANGGTRIPIGCVVWMDAGTHVLVYTGVLADSFKLPTAFGSSTSWVDYDYLTFSGGLTVASEQVAPTHAAQFTRLEAETYGMCNLYIRNEAMSGYSNGYANGGARYWKTQTFDEIQQKGLDGVLTPYVQYNLTAAEEGDYEIRIGMAYAEIGTLPNLTANIALVVNGQVQKITLPLLNNSAYTFPELVTVHLKKGENIVQMTCPTGEVNNSAITNSSACVWTNFDYLEVPEGITSTPLGTRLEAEYSELNNYASAYDAGKSNDMAARNEDDTDVNTMKITFSKLNSTNINKVSWVRYTLQVSADGTYDVGIGFDSLPYGTITVNTAFMAMVVNGGTPQKVSFNPSTGLCRVVQVKLKKGTNTILVTGALDDFMNYPEYPDKTNGGCLWIDHDFLDLGSGVNGIVVDTGAGDNTANVNDPQLKVDASKIRKSVVGNGQYETATANGQAEDNPNTGTSNDWVVLTLFLFGSATGILVSGKRHNRKV